MPTDKIILCLDIGSRTQDVLLHIPGTDAHNTPRFVLPSPAWALKTHIQALTAQRQNIYITGCNMGGGFAKAVKDHLSAGLKLAMHPAAALALTDTPTTLHSWGITLEQTCPKGYTLLEATDFSPEYWPHLLKAAGLPQPELIAVAAQDHGFAPGASNRITRMQMWRNFLQSDRGESNQHGSSPTGLLYKTAQDLPPVLTRLGAIQSKTAGPVLDTASAALLGLLSVPEIKERSFNEGVTLINAGNSHFVAFQVYQAEIYGIYEQHTFGPSVEEITAELHKFQKGILLDQNVLANGGHGCTFLTPPEDVNFNTAYVVGPQRDLFMHTATPAAAYGDNMLSGSFGILYALDIYKSHK